MSTPMSTSASAPSITVCENDLPAGLTFPSGMVAIDTESTGLNVRADPLCVVQVGDGEGRAWLIQFPTQNFAAPNLRAVLENPRITKLFHYARYDLAQLQRNLALPDITPVFCTKIASKLLRPNEGKHNLRTLVERYTGVLLDKTEQLSDWTVPELSASQQAYAASDVLYLHQLYAGLSAELAEAGLNHTMQAALNFLATRVTLDLAGFPESDLFAHN
jgi:ribonuclease D